jgi:N-acetylated-alpha-linked acidic dipeptidase
MRSPLAIPLSLLLLAAGLLATPRAAAPDASKPDAGKALLGFGDAAASEERALEARFDAALQRDDLREWMKRLTARPHHLGSPYDKDNAEFIAGLFRSWGWDTQIEEFRVLFPTPKSRLLEMTAPTSYKATLLEPPLAEDATSGQTSEQLPTFNAYSIDGDVTGELVYVNYGVPKDYEELDKRGVDVKGKIVLARYGGSWRGIKPKVAAEHGAVGCIIFSDPHEDGYFEGDVYPKGGYRSDRSAQRGSVADMPLYAGDPLTPFVGATKDAKRLDRKDAKTLTKIPVLPISYGDALPLLQAMGGQVAPDAWRGSLPVTYHIGPGPARVHLALQFDWNVVPAYDVIAKLAGGERPDEWILRGNHHDAWVNGATDPISGQVAMLEEARAIGSLARGGWRPKRTLVYCAWDGEEPGLLGSTEWVETHADELRDKAAVYINSDSNARGLLEVGGSHTLEVLVNQVGRDVVDPEKSIPVIERARAQAVLNGNPEDRKEARDRPDLRIRALGSGSDYSPFLQHIGISALNIGYGGEDDYGQYHSIYDTFDHYTRFGDPSFQYGIALAQTGGRLVLRLADDEVLPFEFGHFADVVGRYVKEVAKLADDMRDESAEKNRRIEDGTFTAFSDPTKTFVVPKPDDLVPYINFAPLQNAQARLDRSAKAYEKAAAARATSGKPLPAATQIALDQILMKSERALTRKEGLPRRPWYIHHVYAPGYYTGYGVKTLPGVREALEQRNWKEADEQATVVARVLEGYAAEIDRATALLSADSGR